MPIEIKEITIKADVYPAKDNVPAQAIDDAMLEKMKREIVKEVTQAVMEKINHTIER